MTCPNHKRFRLLTVAQRGNLLWTHKEADLAPHPVVGLVLQEEIGPTEKFHHALGFESLNPFFFFLVQNQKAGSMFHSRKRELR